jgi:hypothetical protein
VDVRGTLVCLWQLLGHVGDPQRLSDHGRRIRDLLSGLATEVRNRTAANGDSTAFVARRRFHCSSEKA